MLYVQPHHYEIAKDNGILRRQVNNRFYKKGWPLERAITQPLRQRSTHGWEKWKDVSKVSKLTYMQRRRAGWGEEEAALTPTRRKK